ncbi:MAG TPA: hypothetical protein VGM70_03385 [Pseudolysinimonas sp.]|jgi:hypothetical protein
MTDKDGAAVDPRYDPAFQRGFEGEVATGPRGQSTLRRTAAVNPAPARPAAQRVEELSPTPVEALPFSSGPAVAPDAAAQVTAQAEPAPVPQAVVGPRELARNPFVISLAVLGAVLIVAGAIWAYEGFATIIKNGGTRNEVEFWAAQTMSFGAPLAIVAGVAVAGVLLVLFARSWQRSRS